MDEKRRRNGLLYIAFDIEHFFGGSNHLVGVSVFVIVPRYYSNEVRVCYDSG